MSSLEVIMSITWVFYDLELEKLASEIIDVKQDKMQECFLTLFQLAMGKYVVSEINNELTVSVSHIDAT